MSEPKARHFDLYPVEFLEGISDLDDDTQVSVYLVIILLNLARRRPIANEPKWIGGLAHVRRVADTRRAIAALLAKGKVDLTGEGELINRRARDDLASTNARIEQARVNGRLGGRPPIEKSSHLSGSRQDLVGISLRSQRNASRNQRLRKPKAFQPPTTSYSSSSDNSTDAAREPSPAAGAPARARIRGVRKMPGPPNGTGGPGAGRAPTAEEVAAVVAGLGVDAVDTPPVPKRLTEVIVVDVDVPQAPTLAELAAAHRKKFMKE